MPAFVAEGRHVLRETMITGGLRTITRTRNAAIQTIRTQTPSKDV
jgi:hypothetical protein